MVNVLDDLRTNHKSLFDEFKQIVNTANTAGTPIPNYAILTVLQKGRIRC